MPIALPKTVEPFQHLSRRKNHRDIDHETPVILDSAGLQEHNAQFIATPYGTATETLASIAKSEISITMWRTQARHYLRSGYNEGR